MIKKFYFVPLLLISGIFLINSVEFSGKSYSSNYGFSEVFFKFDLGNGNFEKSIEKSSSNVTVSSSVYRGLYSAGAGLLVGSGILLIGGGIALAVGYANENNRDMAYGIAQKYMGLILLGLGGTLFVVGLPLLIVGLVLRHNALKTVSFKPFIESDNLGDELKIGLVRRI